MATLTQVHCLTSEAHQEVLSIFKDHNIKHSYHVVDGWGLHSVVHSLRNDIEHLIENVKDAKIKNNEKNT